MASISLPLAFIAEVPDVENTVNLLLVFPFSLADIGFLSCERFYSVLGSIFLLHDLQEQISTMFLTPYNVAINIIQKRIPSRTIWNGHNIPPRGIADRNLSFEQFPLTPLVIFFDRSFLAIKQGTPIGLQSLVPFGHIFISFTGCWYDMLLVH